MKKQKKSILLFIVLLFSIILVSGFSSSVYFNLAVTEKQLNDTIVKFCKEVLGKAVKFETAGVDLFGNVKISTFSLSAGPDFNDNRSLIQVENAAFDLNFIALLQKTVKINGISFSKGEVHLHKSFGKTYHETFTDLLKPKNLDKLKAYGKESTFDLKLNDCRIIYEEKFNDAKAQIVIDDFNGSLYWKNTLYRMKAQGSIPSKNKDRLKPGTIAISASIDTSRDGKTTVTSKIKNLDSSLGNRYLQETGLKKTLLSGTLSINSTVIFQNDFLSFKSSFDTTSLNVFIKNKNPFNLISNLNADLYVEGKVKNDFTSVSINKLKINNQDSQITSTCTFTNNEKNHSFQLKLASNEIDLEQLWENYSPFKDSSYKGKLKFNLDWDIDFKSGKSKRYISNILLEDFTLNQLVKNKDKSIISKARLKLKTRENQATAHANFNLYDSDFQIAVKSTIESFFPFKTVTAVTSQSKNIAGSLVYNIFSKTINEIMVAAYRDKKAGYYEEYFLKKKIGQVIVNNSLLLSISASNLNITDKVILKNLKLDFENKAGNMKISEFNLDGYEGEYRLEMNGYFNRDYPFFKIKGGAGNVKLASIPSQKEDPEYSILNLDFDYELNAYRLAQLLDNSKGNVFISLSKGIQKNAYFSKRISEFLKLNNLPQLATSDLNINSINLTINQMGENFYFRNVIFDAKDLHFTGFGKYLFHGGMTCPVNMKYKTSKGTSKNVPLEIKGRFTDPVLKIRYKKKAKAFLFLHRQ